LLSKPVGASGEFVAAAAIRKLRSARGSRVFTVSSFFAAEAARLTDRLRRARRKDSTLTIHPS